MSLPDVTVHDTLPKLLALQAATHGEEVAMREKQLGIWREYTWTDLQERTRAIALGLASIGVGKGDVVALLGDNRPDWVIGEIATHAIGALSLGIYRDALDEEVSYLLNHGRVKVVIVEDEEQVDKLLNLGPRMSGVTHIVYGDPRGMRKYDDPRLVAFSQVLEVGAMSHEIEPMRYSTLIDMTRGEDVAILCTTSGTTAHPKLAMLPSGRLLRHCASYLKVDPKNPGDDYVSVLPLSWIMEQVYAVGMSLLTRMRVNFVEEPETMLNDFREIAPSFVLFAPRLWEQFAADVRSQMMDSSPFKRWMYDLGMRLGLSALERGRRSMIAEAILFRALRDRLGFVNLKSAATGGAALGPDTFRFFQAMGVPLRQLYGQTETMGAYTVHRKADVNLETVGVPFDKGIEINVVDPDQNGIGEIAVRHPNVFAGYFHQEDDQQPMENGWMRTGDAGYIDTKGHLVIIDRIKDIAVTSNGNRFSPQYLENKLKFSPYFAEAVVLGNDRPYLSAIICIRFSIVSKWAEKNRISFSTYSDLAAKPEIGDLVRREVERINAGLPPHQKISRFVILYKELDADDGELTRTRKVRRGVIGERYGDIIDAIYAGRSSIDVDTTITFQDGGIQRICTRLAVTTIFEPKASASHMATA